MKSLRSLVFGAFLVFVCTSTAGKRPNFVWLLSEDNSIHYSSLYGNDLAKMPNIEKLAEKGLVFENAFSCSPVCSVARSTLATGIYAPRGGFQYHRKSKPVNLPAGLKMWHWYLKEAGYYTSNNSKTDYNVVTTKETFPWNESSRKASWRNRPEGAPFYHMQSFGTSHESSLHFSQQVMDSEELMTPMNKVQLADYHPDTPTFRHTYARYHDKIRTVDQQIGAVVKQLETDGLLEDTFIFYFGDHGGVLPRGKGYAYESGLHVPLVIRIPENFRHLVTSKPGSRVKGFVDFVDFGPTVMHLAGLEIPKQLDGSPFLGADISPKQLNARNTSFGHADRFDEKYDLVRTLREGRYHYVRNYQGFYPDGLQNNYRYRMLAYEEWRTLWKAGKLNAAQSQFFERRPAEQLFDVQTDPHEVRNLAGDPKHAKVLARLRKKLSAKLKNLNDLSFYPESEMVRKSLGDGIGYGEKHSTEIAKLIDISDLALLPFGKAKGNLKKAINSKNPWERYWGLTTASAIGVGAKAIAGDAKKRLKDSNLMVRWRAAEFLGLVGAVDPRPVMNEVLAQSDSVDEALLVLNSVVMFNDFEPRYPAVKKDINVKATGGEVYRRLEYLGVIEPKPKRKRAPRKKRAPAKK
ncbi:MAG: sulfatase [Verrucomicrobiales bacterium]|nr:sulfatase [Verrucomicrobiales bacterium]